jgi:hypothetical protein
VLDGIASGLQIEGYGNTKYNIQVADDNIITLLK